MIAYNGDGAYGYTSGFPVVRLLALFIVVFIVNKHQQLLVKLFVLIYDLLLFHIIPTTITTVGKHLKNII